jgi:signal transduction histidine kinase
MGDPPPRRDPLRETPTPSPLSRSDALLHRPSLWEVALLAATVATPLAPPPWSLVALLLLGAGWVAFRPPRRELLVAGSALAVAALLLAAGTLASRPAATTLAGWEAAATRRYAGLWQDLEERATVARQVVGGPAETVAERQRAFQRLGRLASDAGTERASVLLVDEDGEARAWAGTGLLHEPDPVALPRSGVDFHPGFSSVTVIAVEPLGDGRRPWRVVVGRSLTTDRLPFDPPGGESPRDFRWSLVAAATPTAAADGLRLAPPGLPVMVVSPVPRPGAVRAVLPAVWSRTVWGVLGFALLALAATRGVGLALLAAGGLRRSAAVLALGMAGVASWALAAAVPAPVVGALAASLGLAGLGLFGGRWRPPRALVASGAAGAVAVLATAAAAWGYQLLCHPMDLGSQMPGEPPAFCLRLATCLLAFGLLALAGRSREGPLAGDRQAALAALLLLAAGAAADYPAPALLLLAGGGALLARWLVGRPLGSRMGVVAALALLAAIAAGVGWEVSYRALLRRQLAGDDLAALAPPDAAAMDAVHEQLAGFFSGLDLARLAPRPPAGMETQDLAFAVWRQSPLARRNALSALVLLPGAVPGGGSVFSFGLPLTEEDRIDWGPVDRPQLALPAWDALRLSGETPVTAAGRPWGVARWWLQPRPGFRLGGRQDPEEVLVGLLRGARRELVRPEGLPEPALYALYPLRGRALLSPWEESPPVPAELDRPGPTEAVVRTPAGTSWAFARRGADGYEVIYLPRLGAFQALERVGTHAASVLLLLALVTALALLLALPRPAFRDLLARTVRSYSKRLLLVYTALLLVPLLLLNFVLLRTVEASLRRDQRARGEQALIAAEQTVVERILSAEPGFAFTTALSSQYLRGLSRLVDHDVNVYHGSDFLSSSTGELFTAGLLPRRIPGEIYARLALVGFRIYSRTTRIVDTPYLELYAPVTIPGEEEEPRLFLSVPLLAQQEAAAEVLAALRRRALVATTGLFALLLVVGSRLARNFTTPLNALVEGTRRIAAGATSLDLAPSELELAALVQAVDEMARRIAQGRTELLREKALVERMVENITSGVVSLDAERRVLMHNRVAEELLGVRAGERLDVAAARPPLEPLGEFLAALDGAAPQPARRTVRLAGGGGGEREWTLVWVPLPGPGEPSALLVVEDVTEVFRGQRLEAWAEMARIIAHEIKNPLTPVRLSAEHMRQVYATDPQHFGEIFERCTRNILHQVDELQQIASEFSTYSRIPRMEMKRDDLRRAMAELAEAYCAAPPPGVEVVFAAAPGPIAARFDARLLPRAVRNLLENALRASAGGGRVELRVEAADGHARITVADHGPGVPAEQLSRVFDPYFSTHDTGTGLGLPIARRIAEEHGGDVVARNRPGGGLEVEIRIPLA